MRIPQEIAVDIVDPKAYADGKRADEAFKFLRREMPLAVAQPEGFDPFWVVSKYNDILEVERQNELFHNGERATTLVSIDIDAKVRKIMGGSPHLVKSLVQMDNPEHGGYRRLTQPYFLAQNLKKLELRVREIAKAAVDRMAGMGTKCDFARDVAFLYPLHVIMEVLGVPEVDEPLMMKLTQELFGSNDPDLNRAAGQLQDPETALGTLQSVIADFVTYFGAITENRRKEPKDDVASVIANGKVNGQPLGAFEAMSYYIIVATAGHDTTSSTTAHALWALAENPDQFRKVKDNPALIPGLVEESIRWATPVKHFMRTAMADTELRGHKIAKNDWLLLSYPSGNRDEEIFADPFRFDVERSPNKQLAFGYGAHVCLGQHLARLEMRLFWEELLPRLESVELDGEPKLSEANFVSGPKKVPIRFRMH
ncbi:MAG TPA: cytochrome P450 [Rhizomicrobium sp.]|nr:cytochrome P450 [Rhizomicrobium sp.]